jgi:Glycosyltransferases involved in cell wall biogenesis
MVPHISIAIITYNQKDFLKECVESVLAQDYENKEIIIADDCSTDGTIELIEEYKEKYPDLIKIVRSEKNQGITANSNNALSVCTGDYIAWIAGDDLMLPSKLSKQVEFMEKNPDCSLCFHKMEHFIIRNDGIFYFESKIVKPKSISVEGLIENNFIPSSSIVTRRSCTPPFDSRLPFVSDWLFSIETGMKGRIGFIDEVLGRYRRHQSSFSNFKKIFNQDQILTIGILESRFPSFYKNIRKARSNYYCKMGFELICQNKKWQGRKFLIEGLRLNIFKWKAIPCLLISFLSPQNIFKIYQNKFILRIKTKYI